MHCFSTLFGKELHMLRTDLLSIIRSLNTVRGRTIKFANSPPCACRGSTGKKPCYGLVTLTYQRFTAVLLLLVYGSLFVSSTYYCLRLFRCAVARN
jgi:hypothetical protein